MKSFRFLVVVWVLSGSSTAAFGQQSAAPHTSAVRYNVAGQITGQIAPDPDGSGPLGYPATRNTYGTSGPTAGFLIKTEAGQLASWADETVAPSAWVAFSVHQTRTIEYDSQGRKSVERLIGKDGTSVESLVQFSYDSWDRVVCKAVRMNPATFSSPHPDACQLGAQGSYGPDRITRFTYDSFDQILTEERAVGTALAQTSVTNTYYGRGMLSSQTDAKGNRTELRYDTNWRLEKRVYPSASTPGQVNEADYNQYTYDKNGNVTVERKRNATTITNSYDANNRLTFKDLSNNTYSGDISFGYDLRGLPLYSCFGTASTTSCNASGEGETQNYDGLGNLTSRTSRMAGVSRTLSYQYDSEGNRLRITHPDGNYFTYNRDGLNRVCTLGESAPAPACNTTDTNAFLVVNYSAEGWRSKITRAGGAVTDIATDNAMRLGSFTQNFSGTSYDLTNGFSFNPQHQVVTLSQSNGLYNYTEAQNRVGSYGVNGLNQYTQIDGINVSHDISGNLTADGAGLTLTYDLENRLVSTSGTTSSSLLYDVMGRLAQITVGGTTTQFHYDDDALVGEYVGGSLSRRYVHGDEVDEPLVQYNGPLVGSGYRRYLHADHQGSIIAHSSSAGAVLQANSYDAFGIPKSTNDGRFGFTGQLWIPQLGLHYYKARFYSPRLGRFLQTDPIYYAAGMNMYAYASGDPFNRGDPAGTDDFYFTGCNNGGGGKWVCGASTDEKETSNGNAKQANSSSNNSDGDRNKGKSRGRLGRVTPITFILGKIADSRIRRQARAQAKYAWYVQQVRLAEFRVRMKGRANLDTYLSRDEVQNAAEGRSKAVTGTAVHRAVAEELGPGWIYRDTGTWDFQHRASKVKVELTTMHPTTLLIHVMRAPDIPIATYRMEDYD